MLSTSNLSAAQAETDYTKEDYYSKEEKARSTKWVGKGAMTLGLSGAVMSASAQAVIESVIQHCGERESVFRRTKLERFVFEHQLGGQSFDELEEASATHPELIQVEAGKFATQAALNLELNTIPGNETKDMTSNN